MRSIQELKEPLEQRIKIWFSAEVYFKDNSYLLNPETIQEKVVTKNDSYIQRSIYANAVLSVLQISKLYGGRNDHFRLDQFINDLIQYYNDSDWKDKIELSALEEWKARLDSSEMNDIKAKVKGLRDQYYAHTDKDPIPFETLILKSEEMKCLINFSEEVLLKLSVKFFGQYYYNMDEFDAVKQMLKRLSSFVSETK